MNAGELKRETEKRISECIEKEVAAFQQETGLFVKAMDIHIERMIMTHPVRDSICTSSVKLELE